MPRPRADNETLADNILRQPAVTLDDVRKYEREIKQLQAQAGDIAPERIAEINKIVDRYRAEINDILVNWGPQDGPFPASRAPGVTNAIRAKIRPMLDEITYVLNNGISDSFALGYKSGNAVAASLQNVGASAGFFSPSAQLLSIATNHSADLIRTIEAGLIPDVDAVISRGVLGAMTPYNVMQEIDKLIGRDGNGGVSYQAERIVRTETSRIYRIALDEQVQKLAELVKDATDKDGKKVTLKKKWVTGAWRPGRREDHQQMDGVVVPVDEPFVLPDGTRLMYPGALGPDNSPAQTINCGCTYVLDQESMYDAALSAIRNL